MYNLLTFATIFITYLLPVQDADLGWHLRFGQYFLQNKSPLLNNSLTILLHNQPWPNSYTLYQPLVAITYQYLGFWGLSLLTAIIATTGFYLVWLLLNKNTFLTVLVAFLTTFLGWPTIRFGLRGQVIIFLFIPLLFYSLFKIKPLKKQFFTLFFVFLLWANFHGSYFYGLILTFLYLTTQLLSSILKQKPNWSILSLLIPAGLAPLLNPHFFKNYSYIFTTFSAPLHLMIAEWTSPPLIYKVIIIITFLTYLTTYYYHQHQEILHKLFWPLAILSALYLALSARRNLPLFFLIQTLGFTQIITLKKLRSIQPLLTTFFFIFSLTLILPHTIKYNSNPHNYCQTKRLTYPCRAVEFMQQNNHQGRIFNFYRWGGFLTWKLPNSLPFVAGHIPARLTPNHQYPYQLHLKILQARPGYKQQLKKYQIDYILIPPGTFLDLELKKQPSNWKVIYQDKISILYQKKP